MVGVAAPGGTSSTLSGGWHLVLCTVSIPHGSSDKPSPRESTAATSRVAAGGDVLRTHQIRSCVKSCCRSSSSGSMGACRGKFLGPIGSDAVGCDDFGIIHTQCHASLSGRARRH